MESIWTPNEAALSMFCANDETWVEIVPLFGLGEPFALLNGQQIGPWEAGMPTKVPLWLARHLQSKSLGKIAASSSSSSSNKWMEVESLKQILAYEKSHEQLWRNDTSSRTDHDNDEEDESPTFRGQPTATRRPYLPERYWELSQCYSTADNAAAVSLLLHDLWQVRLDKLRRQFQVLYGKTDPLQAIDVTGIGTAELAVMRRVISQSLTQKAVLQRTATLPQQSKSTSPTNAPPGPSAVVGNKRNSTIPAAVTPSSSTRPMVRARVPIRRFRKEPTIPLKE